MVKILVSIGTRGRTKTTLPMTLLSIAQQTLKPAKVIIWDDNNEPIIPEDLRHYLTLLNENGIEWFIARGERKGPHFNHFKSNILASKEGYDAVFRIDDDCWATPCTLEVLNKKLKPGVGAVGCSVMVPGQTGFGSNSIKKLNDNIQWGIINNTMDVDHLYSCFLYRPGIVHFNTALSKVGFREETLFTWQLKQEGYRILVTKGIVWHFNNPVGGIRDGEKEMYEHDENVFQGNLKFGKIFVLDNGIGDHYAFKMLLPEIKKKYKNYTIACCYPEIFHGERIISIAEAAYLLGDLSVYNVYRWCIDNSHKESILLAYRKLYGL